MTFLNKLKIGTKITLVYIVSLIAILLIGIIALERTYRLQQTTKKLAVQLAEELHQSDTLSTQMWKSRFYSVQYLNNQKEKHLESYNQELNDFFSKVDSAQHFSSDESRQSMLDNIMDSGKTYHTSMFSVVTLIADRQNIVNQVFDVAAPKAEKALQHMQISAFQQGDHLLGLYATKTQNDFLRMQASAFRFIDTGDDTYANQFKLYFDQTFADLEQMNALLSNSNYRRLHVEATNNINSYKNGFENLKNFYQQQNDLTTNNLEYRGELITSTGSSIVDNISEEFQQAVRSSESLVRSTQIILIIAIIFAAVISVSMGMMITQNISTPLQEVTEAAIHISKGELDHDFQSEDSGEIGEMFSAFRQLVRYLQHVAEAARQVARGNLAVNIVPQSDRDELNIAFSNMTEDLRGIVGNVNENAESLSSAASQLAIVTEQAGKATNTIAATIQQIAGGSSSDSLSSSSIVQLARAIDSIARGAQEQASAVAKASNATSQMTNAIQTVNNNIHSVSQQTEKTAQSAQSGAETVKQTLQGMERIRSAVNQSVVKVQGMGERSNEIGSIIETIDDISSQTNLLALNAAIEAARAGEYGKGFAVVADEVRKLAERSSNATKEIGSLIKTIQQTVTDAVVAMDEGAKEVELGSTYASQAESALEDILSHIDLVNQQVNQVGIAASEMDEAASQLVAAMDDVSAIVEENTAATEQMAASANEVTESIEGVSASVEEMNAQVEKIGASVSSLADMSTDLQLSVAEFQLNKIDTENTDAYSSPYNNIDNSNMTDIYNNNVEGADDIRDKGDIHPYESQTNDDGQDELEVTHDIQ